MMILYAIDDITVFNAANTITDLFKSIDKKTTKQ